MKITEDDIDLDLRLILRGKLLCKSVNKKKIIYFCEY